MEDERRAREAAERRVRDESDRHQIISSIKEGLESEGEKYYYLLKQDTGVPEELVFDTIVADFNKQQQRGIKTPKLMTPDEAAAELESIFEAEADKWSKIKRPARQDDGTKIKNGTEKANSPTKKAAPTNPNQIPKTGAPKRELEGRNLSPEEQRRRAREESWAIIQSGAKE